MKSGILATVILTIRRAAGDVVPLQPGEEYPTLSLDENGRLYRRLSVIGRPIYCFSVPTIRPA